MKNCNLNTGRDQQRRLRSCTSQQAYSIPARNMIYTMKYDSWSPFCSGKTSRARPTCLHGESVNKNPHSTRHEIALFLLPFFFWCLVSLPKRSWKESRKGGFPHSVTMLTGSIYVSVWAKFVVFLEWAKFVDALMKYYRCYSLQSCRTH